MAKLYVVAHIVDGGQLTIDHFFSPEKAVRHIGELADFDRKPDPWDDPEEFVTEYYDWVRQENDNICSTDIAVSVIDD